MKGLLPDNDLESRIGSSARAIGSSWDAPTPAQLATLNLAEKDLRTALDDLNKYLTTDVAAFRAKVRDAKIELLPDYGPLTIAAPSSK
jgi:hypothetical protein